MTKRLSDEQLDEIEKRAKAFHWQCSSELYGTSYSRSPYGSFAAIPSTPADVLAKDVLTLIAELRHHQERLDCDRTNLLAMLNIWRATIEAKIKELE